MQGGNTRGISNILTVNKTNIRQTGPQSTSFLLTGDPSAYPFDHYFMTLLFAFPLKDAKFDYTSKYDKSVNSSWIPSYNKSSLNTAEVMKLYSKIDCGHSYSYLCDIMHTNVNSDSNSLDKSNHRTFLKINIDFRRNYSIVAILLPIFAIFYLLGAVFTSIVAVNLKSQQIMMIFETHHLTPK